MSTSEDSGIQGWVLYDGSCGFCSRWVPFWENTLKKRGFHIVPLQSVWVVEKLKVSQQELAADLRLLLTSGEQLRGAEVYRYLMKRIWWATTLDLADSSNFIPHWLPGVCDNRYWISRACHLPATGETKLERSR